MTKHPFFICLLFLQILEYQSFATDSLLVRHVRILGNSRTVDKIIFRDMAVKVGDILPREKLAEIIEADRKKIFNTNLFVTVQISFQVVDNQQIDIVVAVKERLYFILLPVFYLADRNFNEWWYERGHDLKRTIYGIYAKHSNLTGKNDQLKIRAETGFISYVEVEYGSPYLDKTLQTTLSLGAIYGINKTMVYRTWQDKFEFATSENRQRERFNFYSLISRRTGFFQNQYLQVRYKKVQIADTIARLNPNYLLGGQTQRQYMIINYTYIYDRRDNRQYALKGYKLSFDATKYGLSAKSGLNQLNLGAELTQYYPIHRNFYANYGLRGKISFPQKQPFLETQALGYRNDLVRGYELYVIDGQSYGFVKTNLKYALFDKTIDLSRYLKVKQLNTLPMAAYVNAFFDVGYVKNNFPELNNTKFANKCLLGGGIGLDVVTSYNVVARLNYSLNGAGEKRLFLNLSREF